jgi:DNA gyrase/topoisomerase IV subunit A
MVNADILLEIDTTLDQLICNAKAIDNVRLNDLTDTELDAFQKTQESLLQHLLHMDQRLEDKREELKIPSRKSTRIQTKRKAFERLDSTYQKSVKKHLVRKSGILAKRRAKRLLPSCYT